LYILPPKRHLSILFLLLGNFRLIFLRNFLLILTIGSLDSSVVHPREIFKEAIKRSAASIICLHNHPSGDPTPSKEDISITQILRQAGEVVGISLLDHVIIGDGKYISLKEQRYF